MHPPVTEFSKTAPGIKYVHHIKTTQASDQCCKACLGSEAVLNVLKNSIFSATECIFALTGSNTVVIIATPPIHKITPSKWIILANVSSFIKSTSLLNLLLYLFSRGLTFLFNYGKDDIKCFIHGNFNLVMVRPYQK